VVELDREPLLTDEVGQPWNGRWTQRCRMWNRTRRRPGWGSPFCVPLDWSGHDPRRRAGFRPGAGPGRVRYRTDPRPTLAESGDGTVRSAPGWGTLSGSWCRDGPSRGPPLAPVAGDRVGPRPPSVGVAVTEAEVPRGRNTPDTGWRRRGGPARWGNRRERVSVRPWGRTGRGRASRARTGAGEHPLSCSSNGWASAHGQERETVSTDPEREDRPETGRWGVAGRDGADGRVVLRGRGCPGGCGEPGVGRSGGAGPLCRHRRRTEIPPRPGTSSATAAVARLRQVGSYPDVETSWPFTGNPAMGGPGPVSEPTHHPGDPTGRGRGQTPGRRPGFRVLVHTSDSRPDPVARCVAAGAAGYSVSTPRI
jgi:hypothetical protein